MNKKIILFGIISASLLSSCGNSTPHAHSFDKPTWEWEGNISAKATFECSTCSKETQGHYVTYDADIESEVTKQPTCGVEGEKKYTATVTFEGKTYTDIKTGVIPASSHTYAEPTWKWNDYSSCKAVFTCPSCTEETKGHEVEIDTTITSKHTEGTCLVKENYEYTATAIFGGNTYKDIKVDELDYGDHKYGEFHTDKEPTYEEEGSKSRTCETCKHVDVVKIPKLKLPYSTVKPILADASSRTSSDVYSGDYFENALTSYSRLDRDNMTLNEKFEADEMNSNIQTLYNEWKITYSKVIDVNGLDGFTNVDMEVITDPNHQKGFVRKIKSTLSSGEGYSYSNNLRVDLKDAEYVTFGFYQDQPGNLICVNTNWTKFLDLSTGVIYDTQHETTGLAYKKWIQFTISKESWNAMGDFSIGIYLTYDLAYGIRATGEPAYITSIYGYKTPSQEGQTVIQGANNVTDVHTWGATASNTEITYNVSTPHGNATKVDIKSKTTVLELKWENVNYASLAKFDYARIYIYAKTTQRVFISLANWRNNVVNIPGVEPFASNNGAQANSVCALANVVADQWNIIDVPTSYFMQDSDSSFFIELWEDKNEAKDGWLFTDFVGHYSTQCIENAGTFVEGLNTASCSFNKDSDDTYGSLQKITLVQSKGYIKQTSIMNISQFDSLSFDVYNESDAAMSLYLYKLTSSVYGDAVKGKYLIITLNSYEYTHVEINIAEYFGTYASSASIMFRLDGAIGNIIYLTSIYGKVNQGGHTHIYGDLIPKVDASCLTEGCVAHYHCATCGKNFDENKKELDSIVIPATGHSYEVEGDKYVCSTCKEELSKDEELVMKKEKQTKQYIFLGSSICNGYHGPKVSECTSMADFFRDNYLLASYTGLSNGTQVSNKDVYLRKIADNGTQSEPYLGTYSYDFDTFTLLENGVGIFNNSPFTYSVNDGRIIITGPAAYLYKFNAVYYGKDNVIKKAVNGFTLSDYQPRWASSTQEVTDRHSYVGLMEELLASYSELDVDEFVVQLSTNDLGIYTDQTCKTHVPFGEVTGDDVRDSSKFDKTTSFGALEWIIAKAKETWGCNVTIFTCQMYDADYEIYKQNNYDVEALSSSNYFQMYLPTLAIANKWKTGLIDVYANKEAEIKLNENKARYKADIVHLTETGYEAVMYQLFREFFDGNE